MDMSSSSDHSHGESAASMDDTMMAAQFCTGSGSVMQPGFMASFTDGKCIIWLFPDAVLDTKEKYIIALIGTFFLAFLNEGIRWLRLRAAVNRTPFTNLAETSVLKKEVLIAVMFGCQMTIAYALMLLTMTFEYFIVASIVGGLAVGHLVFNCIDSSHHLHSKSGSLLASDDAAPKLSSSTPCCNTA